MLQFFQCHFHSSKLLQDIISKILNFSHNVPNMIQFGGIAHHNQPHRRLKLILSAAIPCKLFVYTCMIFRFQWARTIWKTSSPWTLTRNLDMYARWSSSWHSSTSRELLWQFLFFNILKVIFCSYQRLQWLSMYLSKVIRQEQAIHDFFFLLSILLTVGSVVLSFSIFLHFLRQASNSSRCWYFDIFKTSIRRDFFSVACTRFENILDKYGVDWSAIIKSFGPSSMFNCVFQNVIQSTWCDFDVR